MISSIECFQLKTTQSINRLARSETNGEPNGNGMMQKGKGMKSAEGKKTKFHSGRNPALRSPIDWHRGDRWLADGCFRSTRRAKANAGFWLVGSVIGIDLPCWRWPAKKTRGFVSGFPVSIRRARAKAAFWLAGFFFEQVGAAPTTSRLKSGATAASASCWAFCSACWPCSPRELPWGHDPPAYPSDDPPFWGRDPLPMILDRFFFSSLHFHSSPTVFHGNDLRDGERSQTIDWKMDFFSSSLIRSFSLWVFSLMAKAVGVRQGPVTRWNESILNEFHCVADSASSAPSCRTATSRTASTSCPRRCATPPTTPASTSTALAG